MRTGLGMLLLLWCAIGLASGTAYRWVDDDGVVHYSDRPREGAEEIRLRQPSGFAPSPLPAPPVRTAEPQAPAAAYESLDIVQPGQEETLWNIGGTLDVALRVEPELRRGHRIEVYYDGSRIEGLEPDVTAFQLTDVYRGEHRLRAAIYDATGEPVIESPEVTFYVQQTSIQNPQRPR